MFDGGIAEPLRQRQGSLASRPRPTDTTEAVDRIRELEELKNRAAAERARLTAELDAMTREQQAAAGVRAAQQGAGVAAQVGLARRESPHKGGRLLGLAKILTTEMPHTLAAMTAGILSEWRATILVRETACLPLEDRRLVDEHIAGDRATLAGMSDRDLEAAVKKLAYRLDADAVVRRARKAESERTVTIRPAPDTMTLVTALLPVAQGVSVYAALKLAADSARSDGDPRSRGQVMADALVERITGRSAAEPAPTHVTLVMTDRTLLAGDAEPADLLGYGLVPATTARDLVADAAAGNAAWLRRLYTAPTTGELLAMDSRADRFPAGLGRWIDARDAGRCRTPWCDAPIRHCDHVVRRADGGETSGDNGQGLCEACNYAKEALGWRARPRPGPRHTVETTTPTGHVYTSTAPPPPGTPSRARPRMDIGFVDLVLAA